MVVGRRGRRIAEQTGKLVEGGDFQRFFSADGMVSDKIASELGGQLEGKLVMTKPGTPDIPGAASFNKLAKEAGIKADGVFVANAYDAAFILALAIQLDRQARPVFRPWVAHFNLVIAALLVPAAFAGTTMTGPLAWDGLLTFRVKNLAIGVWIVVMAVVLARAISSERADSEAAAA